MRCSVGFDLPDLRAGRARGDVLVVVDVLSFSTAVAAGTARGVIFHPAGSRRRAEALALERNAVATVHREAARPGQYSLSPLSFREAPAGLRVALRSPNGARIAMAAQGAPAVIVAGIVNASACGAAAAAGARAAGAGVTIVACGERTPETGRRRRFAAEDFLGAGAVAAAVDLPRTGEAEAAVRAFEACRKDLETVLLTTRSGLELVAAGFRDDVAYAARLDSLATVPLLRDGEIRGR
jgi:2-phosphosulfolactate phosphatase